MKKPRKKDPVKIHLGCGNRYLKGFINTDIAKSVKADKHFDLNKFPYPFRTNTADLIFMDNVLEHLNDIVAVMTELHRILKPGGILDIKVPYAKSDGALQDPTHTHFFTERSMDYFTSHFEFSYYSKSRFELLESKLGNANKTRISKLKYIIPFKNVLRYVLFNMYDHIDFKLKAIK